MAQDKVEKVESEFTVPFIMGGSWTLSYIRQVQALFKLGVVVASSLEFSGPKKAKETADAIVSHYSRNEGLDAERASDALNDDYNLIVVIYYKDHKMCVGTFDPSMSKWKGRINLGEVIDNDIRPCPDFTTLNYVVNNAYFRFLEEKVAELSGFKAEFDRRQEAMMAPPPVHPARKAAEEKLAASQN